MFRKRFGILVSAIAFALFGLVGQARAQTQSVTASLSGVVSDSSGAVVPDARVVLSSVQNGVTRSFTTDEQGRYSFTLLPTGTYDLVVEKSGFSTFRQQGMVLGLGQAATQDITLSVGSLGQTVAVTSETPLLTTENANIEADVSNRQIQQLPLNQRNVYGLVLLNSQVNNSSFFQAQNANGSISTPDQNISFFNFGGSYFGTTAFLLDGAWTTSADWGGTIYVPSVEFTQEMKLQTNTFSAQYGWSSGNIVKAVTKSGTSSFHGDVFEFLRNSDLDANAFFNNANGLPRTSFRRNQFGVAAGGPLYLPGIYKQRNKTFIYGVYEGLRQGSPQTFIAAMPTSAMKSGDFSTLLGAQTGTDALGRPILSGQVYNPFTTRQITKGQVDPVTGLVATQSGYIRDPFPGNIIPSSLMNAVGTKLLTYFPNPTSSALINNFSAAASAPSTSDEYDIRIDHNVNDDIRLFGRYSYKNESTTPSAAFYGASNPAGPGGTNPNNRWSAGLGFNEVFNPTTVMSMNLGFARWVEGNLRQGYPFQPSTLGLPAFLNGNSNQFPVINLTGVAPLGPTQGSGYGAFPRQDGTYSADFSKVLGAHTLSAGFMGVLLQNSGGRIYPTTFNLSGTFTNGPDPNNPTANTGAALAELELGAAGSGSTGISYFQAISKYYLGWYLQDDWKVAPKLTLNLGLRYELQTAPTDRHNGQAYFDYNAVNPISQSIGFNVPGELVFNGGSNRSGLYNPGYLNFAPRIGLAYKATNKLVIRTGVGVFYIPAYLAGGPAPGYTQSTPFVGSLNGGLNPYNTLSNPFPTGLLPVSGNSLGGLTNVGFSTPGVQSYRATPYMSQWTFDLQYSLAKNDLLDASYIGNRGNHLLTGGINYDQLPTQYLSLGTQLLNPVSNPFYGHITSSGCGLSNRTVPLGQLLLPFPEFCSVNDSETPAGFSTYNSLNLSYTHRTSVGLTLYASYTWSKFIDNTQGTNGWAQVNSGSFFRNNYDLALEKSLDGNDIPQSFVMNYVYEIPVGKGRAVGSNFSKPVDAIIGGWQVSGVTTFKSGFPLSITTSNNNACASFGCGQRPNIVGNSSLSSPSIGEWFNTAAFAQPAAYTFGNAPRYMSNLRSPGFANWDIAIQKWWSFTENLRLQLRAEMFNTFNHTNLFAPDTNLGDSSFGTINASYDPRDIQMALKLYW